MMHSLLSADEPPAYRLEREFGSSAFFLICDHAGALIPRRLGSLGLDPHELGRHIAYDIGAAEVACALSELLNATVILQNYSRLVIDCNRRIGSPSSIVALSERTVVPGNASLNRTDAERRAAEVFDPYHARIVDLLNARRSRGQATLLISVHSFTPVYMGEARRWHAGVLYNRDPRLAHALHRVLRHDPMLVVGDNQPYAVSDESDYAIPEYGEKRHLPHVEIEIRQDLIDSAAGQRDWARRLFVALPQAAALALG